MEKKCGKCSENLDQCMCQIPEKKKEKEHQKSNALANGRKTPKVIIEGEIPRQIRIDEDEEDTNSQGGWTGW